MVIVMSGFFASILVSYIAYLVHQYFNNKKEKESKASEETTKEIAEHNKSKKRALKYLSETKSV